MTMAKFATLLGLAMSAGGVLLLFRFGMPFRVPNAGFPFRAISLPPDQRERELVRERAYKVAGVVGLLLVLLGTAAQGLGTWLS